MAIFNPRQLHLCPMFHLTQLICRSISLSLPLCFLSTLSSPVVISHNYSADLIDCILNKLDWMNAFVSHGDCSQYNQSQYLSTRYVFVEANNWSKSLSDKNNPIFLQMLNEWSHNISDLLGLVMKTTHLINKEEMVHKHMINTGKPSAD